MSAVGYADFVRNEVAMRQFNILFTAEELTTQAAVRFCLPKDEVQYGVNLALNRLTGAEILRLNKGVYYRPERTVFGLVPISPAEAVYREYVETEKGIIGYVTGPTLCQKLGFTTQVPKYSYFATNKVGGRDKVIENAGVVLRQPRTEVNDNNYRYLQILDVIDNKDGVAFEIDDTNMRLAETIKRFQLDFAKLLGYAKVYYTQKVISALVEIATRLV